MKRILVVDDEVDILSIVKLILLNHNFVVETLAKWQNIDSTIQSFHPDLILLDVSLGGADGRDICKQLKGVPETQHIPIIIFSANHNLMNNLQGCIPNAVITKPFDSSHLVKTILANLN